MEEWFWTTRCLRRQFLWDAYNTNCHQ